MLTGNQRKNAVFCRDLFLWKTLFIIIADAVLLAETVFLGGKAGIVVLFHPFDDIFIYERIFVDDFEDPAVFIGIGTEEELICLDLTVADIIFIEVDQINIVYLQILLLKQPQRDPVSQQIEFLDMGTVI